MSIKGAFPALYAPLLQVCELNGVNDVWVQVRPKMILTLTASIMLWSLANKVITKAADASAAAGKWAAAMQKIDATNKLGKLGNGTVI